MNKVHVGMGRTKNRKSVIHTGIVQALELLTDKGKTMTALEYMEKQVQKNYKKYYNEYERGASDEILDNIMLKISYYEQAACALRYIGAIEFDYNAEDVTNES